ncbi:hypothetical protein FH972_022094 [Carpinus fangiana]|uniref:CUE domain-containing protein n=1 Tax=Carpinus fangiana TaxID=176857 RepID=A0A5N6KRL0_9ROSI|nr:hypothetical protein FH972_022094 [Carpinus fangiana]
MCVAAQGLCQAPPLERHVAVELDTRTPQATTLQNLTNKSRGRVSCSQSQATMSDSKTPEKTTAEKQAESPTTARPIDFDDDQQESGVVAKDGIETPTKPPRTSSLKPDRNVRFEEGDEAPPPKPPRPNSPNTEAMTTLKEAFPDIEPKVIHAVLVASGGQVEPAFNALLGMSDPNFQEDAPPPQPPRPSQQRQQEQQDEMYARQLAEHYRSQAQPPPPGGPRPADRDGGDREYSFFEDELPEIRDQLSKGFRDTQKTINKWVTNFRKTIDGEPDSDEDDPRIGSSTQRPPQRQNFGPKQSDQLRGIQRNADQMRSSSGRRSTDRERYDADPRVLSDNFNELELHDAGKMSPSDAEYLVNLPVFIRSRRTPTAQACATFGQPRPLQAYTACPIWSC